jgi:hypothetical protein
MSLEKAPLTLTTLAQQSLTVADGMQIDVGSFAHRGEPSAPFFDLTNVLGRSHTRGQIVAMTENIDELADSMMHQTWEVAVHCSSSREKVLVQ